MKPSRFFSTGAKCSHTKKPKIMRKFAFEADEKHPGAEKLLNILVFSKKASGFSALSLPRFLTKKTRALLVLFSREKKYGKPYSF